MAARGVVFEDGLLRDEGAAVLRLYVEGGGGSTGRGDNAAHALHSAEVSVSREYLLLLDNVAPRVKLHGKFRGFEMIARELMTVKLGGVLAAVLALNACATVGRHPETLCRADGSGGSGPSRRRRRRAIR